MLHHLNLKGSTSRFEERSSICRVLMLHHPKGSTSKDMRKEKKLLESVMLHHLNGSTSKESRDEKPRLWSTPKEALQKI
ncbi:uncharacterized protein [Palaemon carinicauda]|uniref:uncharacterized protein isoform X8 n=1 Tax=Palaemon carinicauda TaxID=392227 RepID=UPI0035B635BC